MAQAVNSLSFAPVVIANKAGIFKKNSLSVQVVLLHGGNSTAQALIGGSVQFDGGAATDVLLADGKGAHLESIAALQNQEFWQIFVSKAYAKAHGITLKESVKTRLEALKGAKIGITSPGSATDQSLRMMMKDEGIAPAQYHEVALGSPVSQLTALQKGAIDAFILDPTFNAESAAKGDGMVIATASQFPYLKQAAFTCIITTHQYADQHPAVVRAMARSIAQAEAMIHQHPNQSLAILSAAFPTTPKKFIQSTLPEYGFSLDGRTTQTEWNNALQILKRTGEFQSQETVKSGVQFTNQYL